MVRGLVSGCRVGFGLGIGVAAGSLLSHDLALGFALGFAPRVVNVWIVCVAEFEFRVWFGGWCPGAGCVLQQGFGRSRLFVATGLIHGLALGLALRLISCRLWLGSAWGWGWGWGWP